MNRSDLESLVLRPSPEVVARDIAGEHLLVPVRNGASQMDFIFTANEVGSRVYRLLDGRRDVGAIARVISQEFEVDEERARADVLDFLGALFEAGLARPAGEEAP
jgi:hypothetical protein